jgi:peptide chain release factor 2
MDQLKELNSTLTGIEAVLDLDVMRRDITELREEAADPSLWNDQDHAQDVTRRLSYLESELSKVEGLRSRLEDVGVLFELAEAEDDADTREEAGQELQSLLKDIQQLEIRTLMSGDYDAREALVTINSQAGGVDAADFAQQLQRMYTRWAERHGYPTEIYETSFAEEAGIKSRPPTPTARSAASTAPTGWSGSRPSTTRAAGRPRSPGWTWCRSSSRPTTSTFRTTTCGWTSTARPVRAGRASTRPTPRCV